MEDKIPSDEDEFEHYQHEEGPERVSSSYKKKKKKKKKKRKEEDMLIEQNMLYDAQMLADSPTLPCEPHEFSIGDLVWGPVNGFPSWPGKMVDIDRENVLVCWFGTQQISSVEGNKLKTLTEGLEDHHKERKKSRRGRKMNMNLEKAIHEAMLELD